MYRPRFPITNTTRTTASAVLVAGLLSAVAIPAFAGESGAAPLLRQALSAQGGEAKLRAIHNVQWHTVGYRNELEQSERPEGPYIVESDTIAETHDHAGGRFSSVTEASVHPAFTFTQGLVADRSAAVSIAGTARSSASLLSLQIARETLALSPERILLTAIDAPDVRLEQPAVLQSVPQDVVDFSLDGAPVRLYLNRYTHLPTAIDYAGPLARSGYWRFLGDVEMRTLYSFWWLGTGGVRLPMQWNTLRNGLPEAVYTIKDVTVNGPLDEGLLSIAPALRATFPSKAPRSLDDLPLGIAGQPPVELAPGVVLIPGPWNVTLVRQDDGVVVLEAPISSGYSAKVLTEARRRFPGLPIKAVVTTSDSWPHLAGIREYAALGIPIYCLDLNQPILLRMLKARYTSRPDTLERQPRLGLFRPVQEHATIGSGVNRIDLFPIRGETSERQMMAWFPQARLLYGSDPFQKSPNGNFSTPQTVTELIAAVDRERLSPQRFFMMHIGPQAWDELRTAVARAELDGWPGA